MDGLSKAIGAPFPFEIDGKIVLFEPLTLRILGAVENHLAITHGSPRSRLRDAMRLLPESVRPLLAEESSEDLRRWRPEVSMSETLDFIGTDEGVRLTAFLCGGVELPQRCRDSWRAARDRASGLDADSQREWQRLRPKAAAPKDGESFVHWAHRIASLLDDGMSLSDIRSLTVYQLQMLGTDRKALSGKRPLTAGERVGLMLPSTRKGA